MLQVMGMFEFSGLKFSQLKLNNKTLDHFSSFVWSKIYMRSIG
jgi:hypothetical protein